MDIVAVSPWNRIRTNFSTNAFLKYSIQDGSCIMAFTDLVAVSVSSVPLLSTAQACNPSLAMDSPNVAQSLLEQAIQNCFSQTGDGSMAIITDHVHEIDMNVSTMIADGVKFVWSQSLERLSQSAEILRDHFIIPLLKNINTVPGLPEQLHLAEEDGPHSPVCTPSSPIPLSQPPSIEDAEVRAGRREEWLRKKEEARKRKLQSLQ